MGETDSTHHMCRDIFTMLQPFNPMRNKEKILVKNAANLIPDLPDFASSLPFENTLFYNF